MKNQFRTYLCTVVIALAASISPLSSAETFQAGKPLGATNEAGEWVPISDNVKVYGSFHFAESCVFDPERNLILVINSGDRKNKTKNDGYVSLINPDGSVHTPKWIGATRDGLELYNPLGSAIQNGKLYIADTDHVRIFDLDTGKPLLSHHIPGATLLNGIAVSTDGTIYVSNTRPEFQVFRIAPDATISVFADGAPLNLPNGIAIDTEGNIVVLNVGNRDILTFSPAGELLKTEQAIEKGSDGIVILSDGTKYISSVRHGVISKITPDQKAEKIASGIPSAASMGYDSNQHQLIIPMNPNNAIAFIKL